jgi:hypothetical protein
VQLEPAEPASRPTAEPALGRRLAESPGWSRLPASVVAYATVGAEYPSLRAHARELYQLPGVAETMAMDQIERHYDTTHDTLNPMHVIPLGPEPDWWAPHER